MPREQIATIGLAELAAIRGGAPAAAPSVGDPRVAAVLADTHSSLVELTTKPVTDGSFTRLLPFFGSHQR